MILILIDNPKELSERLANGPAEIVNFMKQIPGTKHPINGSEDGSKFVVDSWQMGGLVNENVSVGGSVIYVSIHGQFQELPSLTVRSFDRTFLLGAAGPASAFVSLFLSFFLIGLDLGLIFICVLGFVVVLLQGCFERLALCDSYRSVNRQRLLFSSSLGIYYHHCYQSSSSPCPCSGHTSPFIYKQQLGSASKTSQCLSSFSFCFWYFFKKKIIKLFHWL